MQPTTSTTARLRPRRLARPGLPLALVALLALAAAPRAETQELYTFTATALGGLGGSLDADEGDGLDNTALQLGFGMIIESRTHLSLRLGRIDLDADDRFEGLTGAELSYFTASGEYRFPETFYESGVFFGLGAYRLEGDPLLPGVEDDETALGLTLGIVGDFSVTRRFSVQAELVGHFADLEEAQVFATGMVGLAYHF